MDSWHHMDSRRYIGIWRHIGSRRHIESQRHIGSLSHIDTRHHMDSWRYMDSRRHIGSRRHIAQPAHCACPPCHASDIMHLYLIVVQLQHRAWNIVVIASGSRDPSWMCLWVQHKTLRRPGLVGAVRSTTAPTLCFSWGVLLQRDGGQQPLMEKA